MDYIISTESTIDLSPALPDLENLSIIRMEYTVDDGEPQLDEMCADDAFSVFRKMEEGCVAKTMLVSTDRFIRFFEPILQAGHDILHLAFSSGLSGTYHCACTAAEELREQYPERRIEVVDTLAASAGQGFFVREALRRQKEGYDFDACLRYALENRLRVLMWYTVDDLTYLQRGGRVSKAAAAFGKLLQIKPVMDVDTTGHLVAREKVKGRRASIRRMAEHFAEFGDPAPNPSVIISHANCVEDAERLAGMIREARPDADVLLSFIGTVIGAHSGPGTLALYFYGSGRRD